MPHEQPIPGYDEPPAERAPGAFARHPGTGAPWVTHPTDACKRWPGRRADLIALCAQRGIEVPEKATVAQLNDILGPKPKMVMYGRPSSLGTQIENMTNLQKWAERAVALGIFLLPADALHDLRCLADDQLTLGDDDARPVLDKLAARAKHEAGAHLAAERGTFVHKLLEVVDRG